MPRTAVAAKEEYGSSAILGPPASRCPSPASSRNNQPGPCPRVRVTSFGHPGAGFTTKPARGRGWVPAVAMNVLTAEAAAAPTPH